MLFRGPDPWREVPNGRVKGRMGCLLGWMVLEEGSVQVVLLSLKLPPVCIRARGKENA